MPKLVKSCASDGMSTKRLTIASLDLRLRGLVLQILQPAPVRQSENHRHLEPKVQGRAYIAYTH